MRTFVGMILVLAFSGVVSADVLVVTVTDRDDAGQRYEKSQHKLTIRMAHDPDREKRLIRLLKTQDLRDPQPWLLWNLGERKDGDFVTYVVFVTTNPGFTTFRLTKDTAEEKVYVIEGHASLAAMQAMSGDDFQLKSLGPQIVYQRRGLR